MLQISPTNINLHTFQRRYNIKLVNKGDEPLVFKILSTSWKYYQLDRNAGFMKAQSRLELLLTVVKRTPFKEKIQIMYGELNNPNDTFQVAWKKLKITQKNIKKQVVFVTLKEDASEEAQNLEDTLYIRPKSEEKKSRKQSIDKDSFYLKGDRKSILEPIREESELKYILSKKKIIPQQSMDKVMDHIEKERQKYLDAQEREELLYEIEQFERKYRQQLNRSQKLVNKMSIQSQQLQIAQKKLQSHSVKTLKFQIGHSLGVVCQQYHTSFAGLTLLALAAFVLGYIFGVL